MVPLSKSGVRKHRGFESRPLRHSLDRTDRSASPAGPNVSGERSPSGLWRRTGNAVWGNPSRVRIPPSPPPVIEIVPIPIGEFRFAADEPYAGEVGIVVAYAVRHPAGILLFDTGFGFGNAELDAYYQVRSRPVGDALAEAGIALSEVSDVVVCHLHVDHAGQNAVFPGVPIHVQAAEWAVAHTTDHTILEWIDFPAADYRLIDGDHDLWPGIRIVATPGHTPGHQSLGGRRCGRPGAAGRSGRVLGRRVGRHAGGARGPIARPRPRRIRPVGRPTPRPRPRPGLVRPRPGHLDAVTAPVTRPCYPSRAVLGGELAVPCSLQSAPAGPNPLSRSPFSDAARRCDVEDRVPRSGEPRTVSGPEGSSTKRSSSGAAERPGPSRSSRWARAMVDRRRVHGTFISLAPDRRRS